MKHVRESAMKLAETKPQGFRASDLIWMCDCSKNTANKILQDLTQDGILDRKGALGRGGYTYKKHQIVKRGAWTEMVRDVDYTLRVAALSMSDDYDGVDAEELADSAGCSRKAAYDMLIDLFAHKLLRRERMSNLKSTISHRFYKMNDPSQAYESSDIEHVFLMTQDEMKQYITDFVMTRMGTTADNTRVTSEIMDNVGIKIVVSVVGITRSVTIVRFPFSKEKLEFAVKELCAKCKNNIPAEVTS